MTDIKSFVKTQQYINDLGISLKHLCEDFHWTIPDEKQEDFLKLTISNLNFFYNVVEKLIQEKDPETADNAEYMKHIIIFIASAMNAKLLL